MGIRRLAILLALQGSGFIAATAAAQSPPSDAPPPPAEPPPKKPPFRYTIPWQLRPVVAATVVRADTTLAKYEDKKGNGGFTTIQMLTGSYKIPGTGGPGQGLMPMVRLTVINDSPPSGRGGFVMANPVAGAAYALALSPELRLNAFLGFTLPLGGGGGDKPNAGSLDARSKGAAARSQLDNPIFGPNDFTFAPGLSAAYVAHDFTAQVDVTFSEGIRVRGERAQKELQKTNFTTGLHLGYFLIPELSFGADLRYQHWLNAPFAVESDKTDRSEDQWTLAFGPRAHFKLGDYWLRPGVSYGRGLDRPMSGATPNYHIVQIDVPFVF